MANKLIIAHITDLHFPVPTAFRFQDILSKRVTGAMNLLFSSQRSFKPALFLDLLLNLKQIGVNHIVMTGDIVNLAYPEEFQQVKQILEESNFKPDQVSIVPGNHDTYLKEAVENRYFWENLGDYAEVSGPDEYPFVRELKDLSIIGISTAIPSEFGMAYGLIGKPQLERLEDILIKYKNRKKLIILHHPPYVGPDTWDDGLIDGVKLREVLWKHGADLVLHGHEHNDMDGWIHGPSGTQIPVYGTGCAILNSKSSSNRARARLLRFIDGKLHKTWIISHNKSTGHWKPVY
jgi:3',5'-cyclic AMP phosphodiesterase CpdA